MKLVRLATWNIHAGVGGDGRFDPGRVAEVLGEMEANVTALQEVEHHDVDGADLLDYLGEKTGRTAIAGPTLLRGTRHYGNAILTDLSVLAVNRIDLSMSGREPRGALQVMLDCDGRRMQVVATHLGLRPGERRRQVRHILDVFETGGAQIEVLLGDLNEWFLWGRPLRWLHRHFAPARHLRTYPARLPLLALDRIWVRPHTAVAGLRTHVSPLARIASDHLPLIAELTLPEC